MHLSSYCLEQERNFGVKLWLNLVGHGGECLIEALRKIMDSGQFAVAALCPRQGEKLPDRGRLIMPRCADQRIHTWGVKSLYNND